MRRQYLRARWVYRYQKQAHAITWKVRALISLALSAGICLGDQLKFSTPAVVLSVAVLLYLAMTIVKDIADTPPEGD